MKRCEYMIGDWVTCHQETWQWKATDYMLDDSTMCNVNPIPLTDEVLKANGFFRFMDSQRLVFVPEEGGFISYQVVTHFLSVGYDGSVKKNIVCVHELQHALRICGLNELADNFKVGGEE